jgi:hypothetical protein
MKDRSEFQAPSKINSRQKDIKAKFAGVAKQVREKYFASKKKRSDGKPLTQIERRMRSGGV